MQIANHKVNEADDFEIELIVEELEKLLVPTPSIPIPPPFR
jgi:hypothetical protein